MTANMSILNLVHDSFNQGYHMFGFSAGKQCTCCSLYAIAFTKVKPPGNWDTKDIDFIVRQGDLLYEIIGQGSYLSFTGLPYHIRLFDSSHPVNVPKLRINLGLGFISYGDDPNLFEINQSSSSSGILFIIKGIVLLLCGQKVTFSYSILIVEMNLDSPQQMGFQSF